MSYASVYRIKPDGDVEHFADVNNGSAGAPVIWRHLCEKVGLRRYGDEGKLWSLFGSGRLSREEDLCLGFTFDGVYIRRGNIPKLVKALRAFWKAVDTVNEYGRLVGTIPGLAAELVKLCELRRRSNTWSRRGRAFAKLPMCCKFCSIARS